MPAIPSLIPDWELLKYGGDAAPAARLIRQLKFTAVRSLAENVKTTLSWLVCGLAPEGSVEDNAVTGGVLSTVNCRMSATPCPSGRT